jgi:hypothetical protein
MGKLRLFPLFSFLLLIFFSAGASFASTYVVKPDGTGDYVTIQNAIDVAVSGDTICLDGGTFMGPGNKDLDPGGRNLVIMPLGDAIAIIDCEDSGRAFYIHSGENASMIIRGLRLTGGNPPGSPSANGGAILIEGSSPTVVENQIYDNRANFGAGIYMDDSNSLILRNGFTDNEIMGTQGYWGYGHALFIRNSFAIVYDNRFECTGFSYLEVIYILSGSVSVESNSFYGCGWVDGLSNIIADSSEVTIAGNLFENSGGCVWLNDCTGLVRSNHLMDSYHMVAGSGVQVFDSEVDIEYNYFERAREGAIDWHNSSGTIRRNVVTGSRGRSLDYGARAVYIADGTLPAIYCNTFYENEVFKSGGACISAGDIHFESEFGVAYNCIFVDSVAVDCSVVCGPAPWKSVNESPSQSYANWHWGNPQESILFFCDYMISVLVSPVLCDPANDNFFLTGGLPDDTTLVGALPPGCATSDVLETQVPSDVNLGLSTVPESIILTGFSFLNLSNFDAPVNYRLIVEGPAHLDDNGDPSSLVGSTPLLTPGETWTPPDAKIVINEPVVPCLIAVKYVTAYAPAVAIPETTQTNVLIYDDVTPVRPGETSYGFALEQNFPNPANPRTTILFSLAEPSLVKLSLYDVQGRFVATLANGFYGAGRHTTEWNGLDELGQPAASGIYFYRIDTGAFEQTKKLLLLK